MFWGNALIWIVLIAASFVIWKKYKDPFFVGCFGLLLFWLAHLRGNILLKTSSQFRKRSRWEASLLLKY